MALLSFCRIFRSVTLLQIKDHCRNSFSDRNLLRSIVTHSSGKDCFCTLILSHTHLLLTTHFSLRGETYQLLASSPFQSPFHYYSCLFSLSFSQMDWPAFPWCLVFRHLCCCNCGSSHNDVVTGQPMSSYSQFCRPHNMPAVFTDWASWFVICNILYMVNLSTLRLKCLNWNILYYQ